MYFQVEIKRIKDSVVITAESTNTLKTRLDYERFNKLRHLEEIKSFKSTNCSKKN